MQAAIKNEYLHVGAETLGAELSSIRGSDGFEYLWQGDPAYWTGRAYNLFPFVARMKDGKYTMGGVTHEMNHHGFARKSEFAVAEASGTRMVFELRSNDATMAVYPRKHVFRVVYELAGPELAVTYEVENLDDKNMIFGIGAHPGFNVPMRDGKRFEDYRLRFSEKCSPRRVTFDDEILVNGDEPYELENGTTIPLSHDLFDVDAVVLNNVCREVTIETEGDTRSVTVAFPKMANVGFWHKPGSDAPYVCVEPWASLPAEGGRPTVYEEKADLITLRPGEKYENRWTIRVNGLAGE